jgi:hypothetical protein
VIGKYIYTKCIYIYYIQAISNIKATGYMAHELGVKLDEVASEGMYIQSNFY